MKRKMGAGGLALALCALLALAGLSGCSHSQAPQATGQAASAGNAHQAITLATNNVKYEGFIQALHRVYPEINIELVSYAGRNGSFFTKQTLENGDIPDIYSATRFFAPEAQRTYLLDLSGYDFINNYATHLLNEMDNQGGVYLLPSAYNVGGIYYNKTILEENGWAVPTSFEELMALAPKIQAAGYQVCRALMDLDGYPFTHFTGLANTVYFYTPEGAQWKADYLAGQAGAADNAGMKAAVEYMGKWIDAGFISPDDVNAAAAQEAFLNGECAFYLSLGLSSYETTGQDGKTYALGAMPWLSERGDGNILIRNVSRYYGINKALAEPGNEQKLADALHVLEFMATPEGQSALSGGSYLVVTPLATSQMPQDNPFYDVRDLVAQGRTMEHLYVGWEHYITPLSAQIEAYILGEIDADGLLAAFDRIRDSVREGGTANGFATVAQRLTLEETARLCAIALGKAANADAALVSLGAYHDGNQNKFGVNWYLYPGTVDTEVINMVKPHSPSITVLEMSGREIREMAAAGFDLQGDGNPYPYVLAIRGDGALEDEARYRLAVGVNELTEQALRAQAQAETVDISAGDALIAYLKELKTVTPKALAWL